MFNILSGSPNSQKTSLCYLLADKVSETGLVLIFGEEAIRTTVERASQLTTTKPENIVFLRFFDISSLQQQIEEYQPELVIVDNPTNGDECLVLIRGISVVTNTKIILVQTTRKEPQSLMTNDSSIIALFK